MANKDQEMMWKWSEHYVEKRGELRTKEGNGNESRTGRHKIIELDKVKDDHQIKRNVG